MHGERIRYDYFKQQFLNKDLALTLDNYIFYMIKNKITRYLPLDASSSLKE